MKYILTSLFIFIYFNNHLIAQINNSCEILQIKDEYTPLKTYVNDKLVKNSNTKHQYSYILSYNKKKDSVIFYDLTNAKLNDNISSVLYTLKFYKKEKMLKLLIIENKKIVDSLTIKFLDDAKTILINNKDSYTLNNLYYKELKSQIYSNNNISDLIDLIDDNLGDYPYQLENLKAFVSRKKYSTNNNFKILKASVTNMNNQTSENIKWKVFYTYNKKNALSMVEKKSSENELGFKKELLSISDKGFKYSEFRNVESRFEDNNKVTFDLNNKIYSAYQNHFQFGSVKEETSQLTRVLYKKFKTKKILITKNDLKKYLNVQTSKKVNKQY